MSKSIFDILNKNVNYRKEYQKTKDMFLTAPLISGIGYTEYTYEYVFDSWIVKWKYRGTKCSLKEIMEEIEEETDCGKDPIKDCLYLCELILNIREFLVFLEKNYYTNYGLFFNKIDDDMLLGNIFFILNNLNYKIYVEEDYKVLLVKKDADAINTATIVDDGDISNLIMEYNDFKIAKSVSEKQKILVGLANYLEPRRKELKLKNNKLETNLFMAFNKLNIRHNNLEGKDKEEYTSNLKSDELLKWYDETYNLILISIRLLELNNILEPFEKIRKEVFSSK